MNKDHSHHRSDLEVSQGGGMLCHNSSAWRPSLRPLVLGRMIARLGLQEPTGAGCEDVV